MACDFIALAVPGVQKISPYQPGKPIEELERELGLNDIIKLASNENPLGCSPRVLTAVEDGLSELALYPDGNGFVLKQALSDFYRRSLAEITLGNGSNDILELVARAFLKPGDEAVFSQHSFAVYPLAVQAVGAAGVSVPAQRWGHDLPAMAAAVTDRTRVVFIANPNNPTGTWVEERELEAFLMAVPDNVLVVLDEAYFEFSRHTMRPHMLRHNPGGQLEEASMKRVIERAKEMLKVQRNVGPGELFDLSIAREAEADLKKTKWEP